MISIATVAVPARAWWQDRSEASALHREYGELEAQITRLEDRRDDLSSLRKIEELARARYDLVYPDEEAYAVLPPPERDAAWFHAWPY